MRILRDHDKGFLFGQIEDVFVEEQYRRQGIATCLMNEAKTVAKELGCKFIQLTSQKPPAQALYRKLGYKEIKAYRLPL